VGAPRLALRLQRGAAADGRQCHELGHLDLPRHLPVDLGLRTVMEQQSEVAARFGVAEME